MSAGTFIFICTACGYKARLPDQYAGKTIKCPGCQAAQVATAPVNTERKTASIIKVAATPVPFTLPKDQMEALATATPAVVSTPDPIPAPVKAFPSPLPGALQVATDPVTRLKTPVPGSLAPVAKAVAVPGATIDFTCNACKARLRLPAHYKSKSILCPKCSAPQKVGDGNTAPEPMPTTRSHQQREPSGAQPVIIATDAFKKPADAPRPVVQVQVTPLPSPAPRASPVVPSFATPLPSPAPAHVSSAITPVPGAAILGDPAPATDDTLASDIDSAASTAPAEAEPASGYAKPHPSKSGRTNRVAAAEKPAASPAPSRPVAPPEAPRKSPLLLIALIGVFALACIGLGGLVVMNKAAMAEQERQLEATRAKAAEAAKREADMSAKLDELTALMKDLQAQLKAAQAAAATATTAPVGDTPAGNMTEPAADAPVAPPAGEHSPGFGTPVADELTTPPAMIDEPAAKPATEATY